MAGIYKETLFDIESKLEEEQVPVFKKYILLQERLLQHV